MRIRIEYWAQLKQAAGIAAEEVDLPEGGTLARLAARIASRHEAAFRAMLLDSSGQPRSSNVVMVNQQMARWNDAKALRDGDAVTILSPISGG